MKKWLGVICFLLGIWLTVGVLIPLASSFAWTGWTSLFVLKDQVAISLLMSVILFAACGLCFLWSDAVSAVRTLVSRVKGPELITQRVTLISLVCYAVLFVTAIAFPGITGYKFDNEWALIVVASLPLVALVLFILLEGVKRFRAKFGDFEVEFDRTVAFSTDSLPLLHLDIQKGMMRDLDQLIQRAKLTPVATLVVSFRPGFPVDFLALREHVFRLSEVTPLRYIVFVEYGNRYLAFMQVDKFKQMYPMDTVEALLLDISRREDAGERRLQWRFIDMDPEDARRRLEQYRHEHVLSHWSPQGDGTLTTAELTRLGASSTRLRTPTVEAAYEKVLSENLTGIPVVDESNRFLGVTEREKIQQEVIRKLLEATKSK